MTVLFAWATRHVTGTWPTIWRRGFVSEGSLWHAPSCVNVVVRVVANESSGIVEYIYVALLGMGVVKVISACMSSIRQSVGSFLFSGVGS
jgi:hypothetical protein